MFDGKAWKAESWLTRKDGPYEVRFCNPVDGSLVGYRVKLDGSGGIEYAELDGVHSTIQAAELYDLGKVKFVRNAAVLGRVAAPCCQEVKNGWICCKCNRWYGKKQNTCKCGHSRENVGIR